MYGEFVPRVCVDLVLRHGDDVLLVKRSQAPVGWWHLPGGTIYKNETAEQAACRIAKADLGIHGLGNVTIIGVVEFLHCPQEIDGEPIDMHNIMLEMEAFLATRETNSIEETIWTSSVPIGDYDPKQIAFLVEKGILR